MTDDKSVGPDQAQEALNSIEKMNVAGRRRGAAPRWYGIGISIIITVGFALYAEQDPGNLPGLFIALGIVLFGASSRDKIGAMGRAIPDTRSAMWGLIGVSALLIVLFFGGIYFRRAYDLSWIPVATGLIAGTIIFLLSESERRRYHNDD
jgi:hypothetical protein